MDTIINRINKVLDCNTTQKQMAFKYCLMLIYKKCKILPSNKWLMLIKGIENETFKLWLIDNSGIKQ